MQPLPRARGGPRRGAAAQPRQFRCNRPGRARRRVTRCGTPAPATAPEEAPGVCRNPKAPQFARASGGERQQRFPRHSVERGDCADGPACSSAAAPSPAHHFCSHSSAPAAASAQTQHCLTQGAICPAAAPQHHCAQLTPNTHASASEHIKDQIWKGFLCCGCSTG